MPRAGVYCTLLLISIPSNKEHSSMPTLRLFNMNGMRRRTALLGLLIIGLLFQLMPIASANAAATLTVTNTSDSGAGSLRQAIADASAGDTISFASSLNGQAIGLTSGPLIVDKDLLISGPGATKLTISGSHSVRIFTIESGAKATITSLRIADAADGGILNSGKLILLSVVMSSNQNSNLGGALANQGELTMLPQAEFLTTR